MLPENLNTMERSSDFGGMMMTMDWILLTRIVSTMRMGLLGSEAEGPQMVRGKGHAAEDVFLCLLLMSACHCLPAVASPSWWTCHPRSLWHHLACLAMYSTWPP